MSVGSQGKHAGGMKSLKCSESKNNYDSCYTAMKKLKKENNSFLSNLSIGRKCLHNCQC